MKVKLIFIAIFLSQYISNLVVAQNNDLKFNLVEGPDGKPFGKINAITQDPHGYMWFCGSDKNCIYRYDGNRMISFRHDAANTNSLGFDYPETVFADDKGMIWIGGKGLDQYNPATGIFKHYRHVQNDSGSLGGFVNVILKDHRGRLWVGSGSGLDHLDEKTGKFIHYRNEPGNPRSLSSSDVRTIYEDHRGTIWVGTGFPFFPPDKPNDDGGLNRLNPDGTFTRYMHDPKDPHSLINNKVRSIFEDSRGVFWVGTSGDGLHTMNRGKGSFERYLYNPAKPGGLSRPPVKNGADHITFINEDSAGAIWIGTYGAGISRYNPVTKKITHYQSGNGFPDSTCWNGCISSDGVLWISTEDSKLLYRVDPFHKSINSVSTGNAVTSFLEDKEGYLWAGTFGSGLFKYDQDNNLIHEFKHDPSDSFSLLSDTVMSIQNLGDTIWVRTENGVRILNKLSQQFSWFHDGGNLKDSTGDGLSKILRDKQGFIWFGNWGKGLIRYNPKDNSFKHFLSDAQDSSSIASNFVNIIFKDRSGTLWAGGPGGINRLNRRTGEFNHYLAGNFINSLYEDSGGTLWTAAENGFFRYDSKRDQFLVFPDPQSEINTSAIGGIIEDNEKNLWFASQVGIVKLNPFTKETFVYDSRFGINSASLQLTATAYKNRKGELFISHENGFYTFSPEELALKTNFKINLTDFFINTLPVLPGNESPLQKPIEDISNIDLKYNQNNIAFNFTADDYRKPEATKYFTMLENYDNTWREAVGEKSSYYFNISPGKYIYRVKAYNIDGTKAEKVITIHINLPWWETWLFRISAVIFLGVTFYGLMRWRLRQKFRLQLERSEKERQMAELKQKGTELEMQALRAQMNPHFIFNCLNSINRFILTNEPAKAADHLTKFAKLIRIVLQQSGRSFIPLEDELYCLQLYMDLETLRFETPFSYEINQGGINTSAVMVPPLLLQPFVENAIWHGLHPKENVNGRINIDLKQHNEILHCTICDNGVGRIKSTGLSEDSSIGKKSLGIKLTQHRLELFESSLQRDDAVIVINDLINKAGQSAGTCVHIKIPVKSV